MYLLFDLDGTITDSNGLWLDVDLEFARRRGLTVTPEYTEFVTHSIFPLAADFTKEYYHLPESPQEIMEEWFSMAHDAYAHTCPSKEGAVEFILARYAEGIPMALVTASVPELCRAALERLGITHCFRFQLYAQELGLEKRHPAVWERAVSMAGVPAGDCIVFDDSPAACAAARQVGCKTVGIYDDLYAAQAEAMKRDCLDFWHAFPLDQ